MLIVTVAIHAFEELFSTHRTRTGLLTANNDVKRLIHSRLPLGLS
jgi:hypothetical protein